MTEGIHHFAIKVRDLAAAERFYCDVLGLAVLRRWPHPSGSGERALWLLAGDPAGSFLALERADDVPLPEPAAAAETETVGHHLLALRIRVDERIHYEERLAAAGVAVSHRTAYTIYFRDPEGNRLGLSHHPEPAAVINLPAAAD